MYTYYVKFWTTENTVAGIQVCADCAGQAIAFAEGLPNFQSLIGCDW